MGAGATILGGLLGGKDEKTTSEVDYVKMRDNAEKAGFNPLTAIRNGGSAGFTSTTSPGSGGLSAALSAAGNFLTNFDPFADAKREQESRYVEAQINNLNSQSGMYSRTASTPSGPVLRSPGTARLTGSGLQPIEPGKLTATNALQGVGGQIDMTQPDADAGETRYSDAGGWLFGAINAEMDVRKTLGIGGESTIKREMWNTARTLITVNQLASMPGDWWAGLREGAYKPTRPTARNSAGVRKYPSSSFMPLQ